MPWSTAQFVAPQKTGGGVPPLEYFKHHLFQYYLDSLVNQTQLHRIQDPWQLQIHLVEILKAAALYVREWTQDTQEIGPFYTDQALSAISKVIWQQDVSLAEKLFENSPLARKHIRINNPEENNFVVQLLDPAVFLKTRTNPELIF